MKPTSKLLPLLILLVATPLRAEIYQWKGEDGNTVYSDQKTSHEAVDASPGAGRVNYYPAPSSPAVESLPKLEAVEDVYFVQPTDTQKQEQAKLTEEQCQEIYGLDCDRVLNWHKYALEACGNDSRCEDEAYLDRKYRPRTKAEINMVARRAGIRKNNAKDDIRFFLQRKYTNFCANQTVAYCQSRYKTQSAARQCVKQLEANCRESRGIDDILEQYNQLSLAERKKILQEAKAMTLSNHSNDLNYAQMLDRLIDLMLAASAMGI